MSECKCSMSISVLGDGCRYCQPQDHIDRLADALAEETALADHAEELAKLLEKLRDGGDNALSVYWHDIDKALTNYREATK